MRCAVCDVWYDVYGVGKSMNYEAIDFIKISYTQNNDNMRVTHLSVKI